MRTNQLLFFLENINQFNLNSVEVGNNFRALSYEMQSTISKLKDFGINLKDLDKLTFEDVNVKIDIFFYLF